MRFQTTNHSFNSNPAPHGVCFESAASLTAAQKRSIQPLARVASILLVLLIVVGIVGSVAQAQTIRGEGTFAVLPPISLASTGTTQNSLNGPFQVKVGADGSLYVADSSNKRIVKYVPSTLSGYSGCPGGTLVSGGATSSTPLTAQSYCVYLVASGLASPIRGVAVNSAGDVYFNLYPDSTGSAVTTYYYLQYRGLPSASGTTCGTNATNCSGGYNGYNCASQIACTNYTSIHTTNDIGGFGEGMFVDTYGSAIFTAYEGKSYTTAGYTTIERPSSAVTPSTVVNGNVTVLGTPPPTTAASYSEAYITGIGHVWDATEDQWGNIILAGYTGGVYVVQCGNGSSCTPSTSSFTGAKNSTGNGYGGTAGTVGQTTPYPTNIAAVTTAYSTTAGGLLTAAGTGEACDGVTIDGAGNLYASCYMHTAGDPSARIYKFPLTSAGAYTATGYDLTAYLTAPGGALTSSGSTTTTDALQGISFDPTHPNVVYGAVSNSTTNSYIIQLTLGANGINGPINMGSSPIGTGVTSYVNMVATASTAVPASIYAVTLDSSSSDFAVVTSTALGTTNPYCNVGEGTLAGSSSSSAVGGGCVVGVTFTPSRAGTEYGAVIFASSSAVLGWGYLEGTGLGAVATFQTPVEKIVATGLANAPTGLMLDNSGNLYYTATGATQPVQLAAGTWTPTSVAPATGASSLSAAESITMDGAGIIYVVDSSNGHVQKYLPNLADSLTGSTQSNFGVGTAPSSAYGVFADPYGSLYIANTGLNQVQIEPWNGVNAGTGWGTEVVLPAPSSLSPATLSGPKAVTVDSNGNVYVADSGNGRVLKYTLTTPITAATAPQIGGVYVPTYTPTVVTSTATNATALALDPAGNLYIADAGTNKVYKETVNGSSWTESTITTSTLSGPSGIVVAPNGNIFISDTGNNRILEENVASAPTLAFGSSPVSTAASPQTVTLVNNGNAALNATVPASGLNPTLSNADYSLATGSGSECAQASSGGSAELLAAAGGSCTLVVTFDPSLSGSDNGTLAITDNSNTATTATQTINLTGSGAQSQQSQTITFPPLTSPVTYSSGMTISLGATASSGLTVTYNVDSSSTGAGSISGSTLTVTTAGTLVIDANQAGNDSYSAATRVQQSVTVNQASQTITGFAPPSTYTYGSGTITLSATGGGSSLPVTFSVISGPGAVSGTNGSTLTVTGIGTIVVEADQAGNSNYSAATQVQATINVSKASQTITGFAPPSTYTYGSGTITLSATGGGSSNPVTFSITAGTCGTLSGTYDATLTITGICTLTVAANQAGDTSYLAASQVTATIVVNQASQTISFTQPTTPVTYGASAVTLNATATSGLTVSFVVDGSSTSGACSVSGTNGATLSFTGAGNCIIDATQAGNADYAAATTVSKTVVINKATQTVAYTGPTSVTVTGGPYTLTATGGASGNAVVFSVVSGPGSVSGSNGNTLSVSGTGTIQIALNQAGGSNYLAATQVTANITVSPSASSTSLTSSLASVQPGQALTLTATVSGSGAAPTGTITFTATSTGASQGVLGTATLVNGVATYYGLVWAGTDSITAIYNGDSNYSGSTSNAVTVTNASVTGTLQFNWPGLNWAQGVSYGASTAAWPVTLQNLTGVTVTPTIGIANSNFVISGSTCGTLTQGATCSFNVTFVPTSGGSATGTKITSALTATTSTPAQDASIPVSGIAFSSALTFNWPALNFTPTVAVGATSSPWPVTMRNQSGTATTVNSITVPDASYIISNDNCTGQQLAAFASCMFNVTFSPIAADVTTSGTNILSGTLTASGNSGSVTGSLAVGGWAAAALGFNWPGVNFPNQPIGSTGTNPWPVIVTNYSGSALTGLTYTFTGVSNYQAGAFTLTNTCPSLAPGASCTFDIAPSPVSGQSVGAYSANLVVSGSGLSSTSLPATGSAIEGGYSINWNQNQQGGVSTIDFGPQNTANATAGPWPITVYNNTGFAHTVTITPSLGVFTTDVSSLTIAAGGSALFNLYFTPTADQYYYGTLTVSDGTNGYTFNTWGGANK